MFHSLASLQNALAGLQAGQLYIQEQIKTLRDKPIDHAEARHVAPPESGHGAHVGHAVNSDAAAEVWLDARLPALLETKLTAALNNKLDARFRNDLLSALRKDLDQVVTKTVSRVLATDSSLFRPMLEELVTDAVSQTVKMTVPHIAAQAAQLLANAIQQPSTEEAASVEPPEKIDAIEPPETINAINAINAIDAIEPPIKSSDEIQVPDGKPTTEETPANDDVIDTDTIIASAAPDLVSRAETSSKVSKPIRATAGKKARGGGKKASNVVTVE